MTNTSNQIAAPVATGTEQVTVEWSTQIDEGAVPLTSEMAALAIEEGTYAAATLAT